MFKSEQNMIEQKTCDEEEYLYPCVTESCAELEARYGRYWEMGFGGRTEPLR